MPADEWEIGRVVEERVKIHTTWGPSRVVIENGDVTGIELKGCASVFDENGSFSPRYDSRREILKADQIIIAIGQSADLGFIGVQSGIATKGGLISVRETSLETGMPGIFAGGDVTKAPGAIIEAIEAGKKVASSIDTFLGGSGNIEESLFQLQPASPCIGRIEGFADLPRVKIPEIPIAQRQGDFAEIVTGYTAEQARQEAARCLQCDLRLIMKEVIFPPSKWLAWTMENIDSVPEKEGAYRLLDADNKVLVIKGVMNLRASLKEAFKSREDVTRFDFVEDIFYSKRESELIQQYLQEHGEMPTGASDDLDDLF